MYRVVLVIILLSILSISALNSGQGKTLDGKSLYEKKCRSCHKLFTESVGSPMYGMLERAPDKHWIYAYIQNPAQMEATDSIAACLKKQYVIMMPAFPMSNQEIDSIYAYVYSEAKKRKDIQGNKKFFVRCK